MIWLMEKWKDRELQYKIAAAAAIRNTDSDVERSKTQDKESSTKISSSAADDGNIEDYNKRPQHLHHKKAVEDLELSNKLYRLIIISLLVLIASLLCYILLAVRC